MTSLAARYVAKKGPEFVEGTFLPWLRETAQGAGGVAEKLPDKARAAVSSGGDLAEQLTRPGARRDRARVISDADGGGGEPGPLIGRAVRAERRTRQAAGATAQSDQEEVGGLRWL